VNQAAWAGELVEQLNSYQGLRITTLELLDALGFCGLQLVPGNDAATAFWLTMINEQREEPA
jgi:hypothetical protein